MGKKQVFIINDRYFDTKKAVQTYIQGILNRQTMNTDLGDDDLAFISALLERHPRCDEKVGSGIASIQVRMDTEWGKTRQFFIIRTDGTATEFSYLKCLKGELESKLALFKVAARSAILEQIIEFKERYFKQNQNARGEVLCQATGSAVNRRNSHIDHDPKSFDGLVEEFIQQDGIVVDEVDFIGFDDGEQRKRFADHKLEKRFADFHLSNASLRVVTVNANLKKKKR